MNEYPEYFPPFLQDFHAQKDFFKAFYVWQEMMDNRYEIEESEPMSTRISSMGNFWELHVLFNSVLDFLFAHGWQLYRTRKAGEYASIDKSVEDLKDLRAVWYSLAEEESGLRMKDEYITKYMEPFLAWLPFMPSEVQEAWREFKERQAANSPNQNGR